MKLEECADQCRLNIKDAIDGECKPLRGKSNRGKHKCKCRVKENSVAPTKKSLKDKLFNKIKI